LEVQVLSGVHMKFEFSAGGVVYKQEKSRLLILVCQHSQHHGWVFPKGLIGDHKEQEVGKVPKVSEVSKVSKVGIQKGKRETKEEAALREVFEETGVKAEIIQPLTPITYWYQWEGEKIRKTVYYFIMKYLSGNISKHDFEMENVEWIPVEEVENRLTYPSDKKVWQEAIFFIKQLPDKK
jgi:8-oxo-dGTP diphosphatase